MTKLFTRNGKLKKAEYYTVNFGIPALKTCPMADACKSFCYANKGAYAWPQVKAAYEWRYQQTRKPEFIDMALNELKRKKKLEKVRIHDSGDFYNKEYLYKWIEIAKAMPNVEFYAYTKRVKLLKDNAAALPSNFTIIYSIGGREDHLIDKNVDRHSKIFNDLDSLVNSGYIDTSYNDSNAVSKANHRIGLVAH